MNVIPALPISWKIKTVSQELLYRSIYSERKQNIHRSPRNRPKNPARPDDVPWGGGMNFAIGEKEVFLTIVEIWRIGRRRETGIGLWHWDYWRTEMGAIVFDACLKNNAVWLNSGEGEGGEEVGENTAVYSV
jgi:hypothetical protein